jgi:hypothetical protein
LVALDRNAGPRIGRLRVWLAEIAAGRSPFRRRLLLGDGRCRLLYCGRVLLLVLLFLRGVILVGGVVDAQRRFLEPLRQLFRRFFFAFVSAPRHGLSSHFNLSLPGARLAHAPRG